MRAPRCGPVRRSQSSLRRSRSESTHPAPRRLTSRGATLRMARMGVGSDVEASRLRTLLRDLAALADIPGVWLERAATMSDSGTREVALGLADALVGLLDLDFAFVRLSDPGGAGAQVVARGKAWRRLEHVLERRMPLTRRELVADANDARRGLVLPIGPGGEAGVLAVAGERSGFPSATDQLLLSLAANL